MRRIFVLASTIAIVTAVLVMARYSTASAGDKDAPDLDGQPDLVVRPDLLAGQWLVRVEKLSPTACSVIEGEVAAGERRLVRFTVGVANIGDADIYVGDPNDHIAAGDGLFEFAACHNHYHFRHYAIYQLIDDSGHVWRSAKRGFCMLDTDPNPASLIGEPPGPHYYRSCGRVGIPGNQGISVGWTDTYRFFLGGQYFVLDGGDGQPVVPAGWYTIVVTANPGFVPQGGEPCGHLDTTTGLCHQLPESDYSNNVGTVRIFIPDHPGREGVGPMAGSPLPSAADEIEQDDSKLKTK